MTTALQRRQTLLPPVSPAERAAARGARITPDYRLDELRLDPQDKTLSSIAIGPVLTDGTLTLTIAGASTIELVITDPDKTLLTGNFLTRWLWGENADHRDDAAWIQHGRKIDVQLDDLWFRLRRLEKNEGGLLKLELEDRLVSKLRATSGPKVATRGTSSSAGVTRAQFVQSMCRDAGVPFYIPEVADPQPIQPVATTPSSTTSASQRKQRGQKGLDRSAHITVKGAKANPGQLRNIEIALDEGTKQRAPDLALLACLCAGTGESGFESIANKGGSNYTGVFQGSKSIFKATDTQKEAYWFFHGGKGYNHGGAIHLARSNPSMSPGAIADQVESGGAGAGFYDAHLAEAKRTLAAYKPGISNTGSTSITVEKAFQFTRGKTENSWDAIQRLAAEVQWRAFIRRHPVTGEQALWYVSDQFLAQQAPAMTVWEHRPGRPSAVGSVTYAVDLGARNSAADLNINARVGRWTALPGMRPMVEEEGPADGGWLIQDVTRPLWDPVAQIVCTKPVPSLAEPAPQTETLSIGTAQFGVVSPGAVGQAQRLYDACKQFSGPYVWGGGHGPNLSRVSPHQGLDCSSSCSLALFMAGLFQGRTTALVSGGFSGWGQAGTGKFFTVWYHSGHVFIELSVPGRPGKRFDTSPHGSGGSGPRVRNSHRSHAGFSPRHLAGL